jgi:hypothetical protein
VTNHEGHKRLWNRLAKTGEEDKYAAFEDEFGITASIPPHVCFACKEAGKMHCAMCPIVWDTGEGQYCCTDDNTAYSRWCDATTKRSRQYWARVIRDLPWRTKE